MKNTHFLFSICLRSYITAFLFIGILFSCQNEEEPNNPTINIPKKAYTVESTGGIIDVILQSDVEPDIHIEEKEWLHSANTDINLNQFDIVSFVCDPNPLSQERTSQIVFTIPETETVQAVSITQKASAGSTPCITSFVFEAAQNPQLLTSDIVATINEDGTVFAHIPYILPHKKLIPTIKLCDEKTWIKVPGAMEGLDFSSPLNIVVENMEGKTKEYNVSVYAFTGLPVMYIHTENDTEITTKEKYINAHLQIVEDIYTRSGEIFESDVTIKGRGNSTWSLPKKPYALKFNKKTSLLGEPKDKSWVLLANYTDKSNLRNEVSFFMGRISNLEWTPRTHFVELFVNEVYRGTYQLCEKIKIADSRVNITDDGYLMEIDQPDRIGQDISFKTKDLMFCVKDPDIEKNGERHKWISDYVNKAEKALLGNNFLDETEV